MSFKCHFEKSMASSELLASSTGNNLHVFHHVQDVSDATPPVFPRSTNSTGGERRTFFRWRWITSDAGQWRQEQPEQQSSHIKRRALSPSLQSQKAETAYLKSRQLLPFGFARAELTSHAYRRRQHPTDRRVHFSIYRSIYWFKRAQFFYLQKSSLNGLLKLVYMLCGALVAKKQTEM